MAKPKILIFETRHALTNYLIQYWTHAVDEAISRRGRFAAALSGGRTPVEFYCRLSGMCDYECWQKTHIFLTDERFVPADHPSSNFGMIKRNLLDYVDIPSDNIHPVDTTHANAVLAASAYEESMTQFFHLKEREVPVFDFMLLGLGEDGHTASLFPENKIFKELQRLAIGLTVTKLEHPRISLTLPVINLTRDNIILACGRQKARTLKEVLAGNQTLPAAHINPSNGRLTYLLDKEAASELSYGDNYVHQGQAIAVTV